MNLFFEIVSNSARLIGMMPQYDAYISEEHHRAKKDAPSGTALNLLDTMRPHLSDPNLSIASVRAGWIPGTHVIGFDSEADTIILEHRAAPLGFAEARSGRALIAVRTMISGRYSGRSWAIIDSRFEIEIRYSVQHDIPSFELGVEPLIGECMGKPKGKGCNTAWSRHSGTARWTKKRCVAGQQQREASSCSCGTAGKAHRSTRSILRLSKRLRDGSRPVPVLAGPGNDTENSGLLPN
jgi:hypothetical protein